MKKILSITILIIGLITITNAQGITNTLSGNTAADKFIVENKNSEAGLVVTGEGNVGIGTENPSALLELNAPANSNYTPLAFGESGLDVFRFDAKYSGSGIENNWLILHDYWGNDIMTWRNNRVGIGTTNPQSKLSVGGDGISTAAIYGEVTGQSNYGVHGSGVWGGIKGSGGKYGINGSGGAWDFFATGSGQDYGSTSSIRWKTNIVEIDNPLKKLAELRGVYFDWDEEHGGQHDVGMIAEEVGKVLPEIVVYEENGIDADGMDYSKLTPLLVEAVKELQQIVLGQQARIKELENR